MRIQNITILGGAEWKETDEVYKDCFETCKLLAQNGYTILNGGGPGVMKAATKGAHAGGGKVLGVILRPEKPMPSFEGHDKDNNYDEEVAAEDYFERTKMLLQMGQCHVIFKGGTGTISEFGMSWASARIHTHKIPLVLFGEFWHDIVSAFKDHMYMRPEEFKLYTIVKTPEEVLDFVHGIKDIGEA